MIRPPAQLRYLLRLLLRQQLQLLQRRRQLKHAAQDGRWAQPRRHRPLAVPVDPHRRCKPRTKSAIDVCSRWGDADAGCVKIEHFSATKRTMACRLAGQAAQDGCTAWQGRTAPPRSRRCGRSGNEPTCYKGVADVHRLFWQAARQAAGPAGNCWQDRIGPAAINQTNVKRALLCWRGSLIA